MGKVTIQICADPDDVRTLDLIRIRHNLKTNSQAYHQLIHEYIEMADFILEIRKKEAQVKIEANKRPSNPMVNL